MMLDAFLPEGVTELAVDSIFMMPQLGVLASVHPKAATEVFHKDCLIRLGSSVAPWGVGKPGEMAVKAALSWPGGRTHEVEVPPGEMRRIPAALGETVDATLTPGRNFDLGEGKGKRSERSSWGRSESCSMGAGAGRPPADRARGSPPSSAGSRRSRSIHGARRQPTCRPRPQ